MKKKIVIKFSGKVFAMENVKLLKDYARFLVKISKTYQPIIVAGGGKIARHYITHARSSGADESTLDELGIEISRLNAKLLIYALKDKAYPHPPTTLREAKHAVDSGLIVIAGGLHPGQSTNGTAALIAEKVNAEQFLNATDVSGIYDSDPNKNKKAKLFKTIEMKSLKKLISAPSFRLKGGGWYETDFKTGKKKNISSNESSNNDKSTKTSQSNPKKGPKQDKIKD